METVKVSVGEFREKLANYLLQNWKPSAITSHGHTMGYYLPARRHRTKPERGALKEAASQLQQMLADNGISEEHEVIGDFNRWREARRT